MTGGPHVRKVQQILTGGGLREPNEGSRSEQGAGESGAIAAQTRRHYGSLRRLRGTISERSLGLRAVSTNGTAGHRGQNQNRRHQDSRHPDDATDGGTASRRHETQRL